MRLSVSYTDGSLRQRYGLLLHTDQWGTDIRTLCIRILEASVLDSNKYQVGLTKIFFRAGLLASFEQFRNIKLNSLAVLMQKNFRRYMERKKYLDLRKSTIAIQSIWRGTLAKRRVDGMRKEVAALLLQRTIRGYLQRQRFLLAKKSIISVQSREHFFLRCSG